VEIDSCTAVHKPHKKTRTKRADLVARHVHPWRGAFDRFELLLVGVDQIDHMRKEDL
jgi:hypothetical protein